MTNLELRKNCHPKNSLRLALSQLKGIQLLIFWGFFVSFPRWLALQLGRWCHFDGILINILRIDLTEVTATITRRLSWLGTCFFQLQIPLPPQLCFQETTTCLPVAKLDKLESQLWRKKHGNFMSFKKKAPTNMASEEIWNSWNESGLLI